MESASPTTPEAPLPLLLNPASLPDSITSALKKFKTSLDFEGHVALNSMIEDCLGLLAKWKLAWIVAEKSSMLSKPRHIYARKVATSIDKLADQVWKHAPAEAIPVWQECTRLFQTLAVEEPNLFRLKYARSAYKVRRYSEISTKPAIDPSTGRAMPKRSGSLFIHLDAIPILTFSVEKFCQDIIEGTFAEGSAMIRVLKRRKARTGLKHEFLILKAISVTAGEFWVRIDRAASQSGGLSLMSVSSLFPAKDSILIAKTEQELIEYSHANSIEKMIVDFPKDNVKSGPTLRDLVTILGVVQKVSPTYSLVNENCFFLASILEEALQDLFDGVPTAPIGTRWSEEKAPKAREDVLSRLYWNS